MKKKRKNQRQRTGAKVDDVAAEPQKDKTKGGQQMKQYTHYRATEKRLYTYRAEQARRDILLIERKNILERIMPSVGVAQYGEHIGRASDALTGPEQAAEQGLKQNNRLWEINREIDAIEARCHIIDYAIAVLWNLERDIVKARYFDGLSMERVSECVCYSVRQCWRLKDDAVRKIGAVLFGE